MLLDMDDGLVGVDGLLEVHRTVAYDCKRGVTIVILVESCGFLLRKRAIHVGDGEYAPGEIAPHGDEIDFRGVTWLQLVKRSPDLYQMLMAERLVDRQIVGAPAEMGRRPRFYARPGRAGQGL